MRYSIFSDLHANLQAWEAVRADMERQRIDVHVCLGDVVGYGPRPQEVLESVYAVTQNFVLGNHDAVIGGRLDPEIFNDHAREIIEWTNLHLNDDARQFFAEVPLTIEGAGFLAVHAEAAQPGRFLYIVDAEDARESFDKTKEQLIFVGHTHHPGRFEKTGKEISKFGSDDFTVEKGKRYVVNTGSVGEPRTPDVHASYCIYDSFQKKVSFRKLPFDIEGYKRDLIEVGLPIRPYFLDVYESGEASMVHQPAELAMKRSPKIVATGSQPGRNRRVVVQTELGHETRSFSAAADAYRETAAKQGSENKATLWVVIALCCVAVLSLGLYAILKTDEDKGGGGDRKVAVEEGSADGPASEWEVPPGDPVEPPAGITWDKLVVIGFKNLAREAKVTSDGFPADWGSKGEAATVDGDAETFLKKEEGKESYRVALEFKAPTKVDALSLSGFAHHQSAPEDFAIYADGKELLVVTGAQYVENALLIPLPEVTVSQLELRISKAYDGSPAIREMGVYDWDLEEEPKAEGGGTGETVPPVEVVGPVDPPTPPSPPAGAAPEEIDPIQPTEGKAQQTYFVPIHGEGTAKWHYTTVAPAADWTGVHFEVDGNWKSGVAGFGNGGKIQGMVKTPWKTRDIWMRTRFTIPADQLDLARFWYLQLIFDDMCEVHLNGAEIFSPKTYSQNYVVATMPDEVKALLKEGVNTLAVHCKQETGEQLIDVGVVSALTLPEVVPPNPPKPGKPKPVEPVPGGAGIVRLQRGSEGYVGVADARIALTAAAPGSAQMSRALNMGGQLRLSVGIQGGLPNRALLRFDLTGKVPEGKKPGGGTLTLAVVSGADGQKVDLYLIHPKNAGWVEGVGKSATDQGDGAGATWLAPNSAATGGWFGGDGLGNPGRSGGYLSLQGETPACSGVVDGKKKVIQFPIPEEVIQLWNDQPEKNAGVLLRVPDEDPEVGSVLHFHSSESDQKNRPLLEFAIPN